MIKENEIEKVKEKVEELLEKKVRPILKYDDGDIKIEDLSSDGVLTLSYSGRCSGCPGIEWTHTYIVMPAIKQEVPEIKEILWRFDYGIIS